MSLEIGNTFYKNFGQDSYNGNHTDLIYSFNMVLKQEGILSQRVRYNLMMILGESGGLLSSITAIFYMVFSVLNYKETHSVVYEEYCRIEQELHGTGS